MKVSFTAGRYDPDEFGRLCDVLAAMGVGLELEYSATGAGCAVTAEVADTVQQAEAARTRRAGRRRGGIEPPAGSPFSRDTAIAEFLKWLEGRTSANAQAALGLAPATYFRYLRIMSVSNRPDTNGQCKQIAPLTSPFR